MSCGGMEQAVVLYAGGDLAGVGDASAVAELERHLAGCAACRDEVEAQRRLLEELHEAHAEPIAAADYAAVRARVLAELESRRVPWWGRLVAGWRHWPIGNRPQVGNLPHWVWGLAGAAALAVALLFVVRTPAPPPAGSGLSLHAPAPPQGGADVSLPALEPPRVAAHRRGPGRLKPAPPTPVEVAPAEPASQGESAAAEPLVIKLYTNDPNVVIYWIAESKGE
jgi:hypothetical protein